MSMPGKMKPFFNAPGQVTDDSELAMCQLCALAEMEQGKFSPALIGNKYLMWFFSNPFDIGNTTRTAFQGLRYDETTNSINLEYAQKVVKLNNYSSQSNGSLMRCTPIAVYSHLLEYQIAWHVIKQDVLFTHCHINVVDAIFLYCSAIGYLIRHADSETRAADAIQYCTQLCEKDGPVGDTV